MTIRAPANDASSAFAVARLLRTAERELPPGQTDARGLIVRAAEILERASRGEEYGAVGSSAGGAQLTARQLRQVLDFIGQHLGEKLSVGRLAAVTGLSASHFSRAFAATMGATPYAYLSRRRIERAQELILANLPLCEVALECGFTDQAHLSRLFRRYVGISPRAWRRAG